MVNQVKVEGYKVKAKNSRKKEMEKVQGASRTALGS